MTACVGWGWGRARWANLFRLLTASPTLARFGECVNRPRLVSASHLVSFFMLPRLVGGGAPRHGRGRGSSCGGGMGCRVATPGGGGIPQPLDITRGHPLIPRSSSEAAYLNGYGYRRDPDGEALARSDARRTKHVGG